MARLGVAPHVADKILNHQAGTISGVAAVYQRHDFLAERRAALDLWGAHIQLPKLAIEGGEDLVDDAADQPQRMALRHSLFEVDIRKQFTRP
jgi:hypothetical protein